MKPNVSRNYLISIGFREIPHFTIQDSLVYDLGRNRHLSIGGLGTPNEFLFICEVDENDSKNITDIICLHNYDYDGYISKLKLKYILKALTQTNEE